MTYFKGIKIEKCAVSGCPVTGSVEINGKNKDWHLCNQHYAAWGYYLHGAEIDRPIRVHSARWDDTMDCFVEYCSDEIAGLNAYKEMLKTESPSP